MQSPDEENIIFKTAAGFINNSNHPVFLTGKAGTGKTTFLKFIKEHCSKNIAVVAPTGVAAINAGGTTIHSFFQLPFAPFVPVNNHHFDNQHTTDKHNLLAKLRLNSERKEIMQELELLIIDEISMVRCDVLDAIDTVLRQVRNKRSQPFGGVQVLYIGDMYQLPPVIKDEEWQLLRSCYENQYFFSSHAIISQPPIYIELEKVYRQTDLSFINLLNKVRNNEMEEKDYELLHSRFNPGYIAGKAEGFITLTTHNNKADAINTEALADLPGAANSFKASIEGEFQERAFPADEHLNLKPGAQVMFIKNDNEKIRRYYNGKIGTVHKIEEDKIWVECVSNNSSQLIEVKKETWRNIKYTINAKTQHIEEQELGSFTQYPLRLAWAITIHKSQGLTFEKAIIDAGSAFAPGQVYVALSRCTSLQGIILKSKILYSSLNSDERIVAFASKQQSSEVKEALLIEATKNYQQDIIRSLFDFHPALQLLDTLIDWVKENQFAGSKLVAWLSELRQRINVYKQHGSKFTFFLDDAFLESELPEKNEPLQQRLAKAVEWFLPELQNTRDHLLSSPAITDNRQLAIDYDAKLERIFHLFSSHTHLLVSCKNGFTLEKYREQKSSFRKATFIVNTYSGRTAYVSSDVKYPDLYMALKDVRDTLCREKNLPVYMVCSTQSLEQMANFLPKTLHDLGLINGFGKIKLKQFGHDFITVIQDYCDLHNLETSTAVIPVKKIKKEKAKSPKPDSKRLSFELYEQGKNLAEIATSRNLSLSTIEGHLAYYIETGELNIDALVNYNKQTAIKDAVKKTGNNSMKTIKELLPEISYGEIKLMMAYLKKESIPATG